MYFIINTKGTKGGKIQYISSCVQNTILLTRLLSMENNFKWSNTFTQTIAAIYFIA